MQTYTVALFCQSMVISLYHSVGKTEIFHCEISKPKLQVAVATFALLDHFENQMKCFRALQNKYSITKTIFFLQVLFCHYLKMIILSGAVDTTTRTCAGFLTDEVYL